MADNKLRFGAKIRKVKFFFEQNFPRIAGNMMVQQTEQNFQKEGFTDSGFSKWVPRNKNARKNTGRGLLVDTGDLKRTATKTPRVRRKGRDVLVKQSSDLPYAGVHNNGTGRSPKRQFMGRSRRLEKKIERRAIRELDRIFK